MSALVRWGILDGMYRTQRYEDRPDIVPDEDISYRATPATSSIGRAAHERKQSVPKAAPCTGVACLSVRILLSGSSMSRAIKPGIRRGVAS